MKLYKNFIELINCSFFVKFVQLTRANATFPHFFSIRPKAQNRFDVESDL